MNKDLTFNAHAGQGRGLTYSIHRVVSYWCWRCRLWNLYVHLFLTYFYVCMFNTITNQF